MLATCVRAWWDVAIVGHLWRCRWASCDVVIGVVPAFTSVEHKEKYSGDDQHKRNANGKSDYHPKVGAEMGCGA